MNLLRRVLLVLLLLASVVPVRAEGPLRIGTEGAYPPFNYRDENGKPAGFDVDIAFALCRAMGRTCTVDTAPWSRLLPDLEAGKFDMIVASLAKTPQREEMADFSDNYYRSRSGFVADPHRPFIQTQDGLAGKTLGAQTGTVQADYLKANYGGRSNIVLSATTTDLFRTLVERKTDAVLVDSLSAFFFLQTPAGLAFDFVGVPLSTEDASSVAHIAVRRGDHKLLSAVNAALRTIRQNGEYGRINRKYFPFSIY